MKIAIILAILFLLTGCNDYVEINDLGVVTGIVLDYKDDLYELTSQIIVNEKQSKIVVYTSTGKTIEEAIGKTSKLLNKQYYIAFIKILVITENIIKNDVNYYDYFLRESKSKMNFYVYYCESENAKKILDIYKNEDGSSLYVDKMMKFNEQLFSSSTPLEFIDLIYNKLEPGINPIYPTIAIKKNNDEEVLYLGNLVSFNSKKELLTFNENESIIYNLVTNNMKDSLMTIPCNDKLFTLNIENVKTKFKWKNNTFTISSDITSKINDYDCNYDIAEKSTLKKLANISKQHIKENIENLITLAKNKNNDFIGIGNYIFRRDKELRKKNIINAWDEYLKNINITIKTNVDITSTGELRKINEDNNGKN